MFYNVLSAAFYSVVKTDYCALFLITGHVFELSFSGDPGVCDILNARGYVEKWKTAAQFPASCFFSAHLLQYRFPCQPVFKGIGNTVKSSFGMVQWLQ